MLNPEDSNDHLFNIILFNMWEILEDASENIHQYNPDYLAAQVKEYNRIIDNYLGPMRHQFPRYVFFHYTWKDKKGREAVLPALAYLEPLSEVTSFDEVDSELLRWIYESLVNTENMQLSQVVTDDPAILAELTKEGVPETVQITAPIDSEIMSEISPTQDFSQEYGMVHAGMCTQFTDDEAVLILEHTDQNGKTSRQLRQFNPHEVSLSQLITQCKRESAKQVNAALIFSPNYYFNELYPMLESHLPEFLG